MAKQRLTYEEAEAKGRALLAEARLTDPDGHFPYKREVVDRVLAENPPMGPGGPNDSSVRAQDFMSSRIAEASEIYIKAQEAYLRNPTPATLEMYQVTADDLVAARQAHRRNRVDGSGNPVANIVAATPAASPDFLRGPRFRRTGEE